MKKDDYKRWYKKGKALMAKGELKKADQYFKRSIEMNPTFAPAYWGQSQCLFSLGNREECINCIEQFLKLDIDKDRRVVVLSFLGYLYADFEDMHYQEKAEECFARAIELDPKSGHPYYARGVHLATRIPESSECSGGVIPIKTEQFDAAVRNILKAYELNQSVRGFLDTLNRIFSGYWDDQGVIEVCTKLLQDYPSSAPIYFYLGAAYHAGGETALAFECLNKSIEINPASWTALVGRGVAYGILGKYDEAIRDITKAIELEPTIWFLYLNRSIAYLNTMDIGRAIQDVKKAISLSKPGECMDNLLKMQKVLQDPDLEVVPRYSSNDGKSIEISSPLFRGQREPFKININEFLTNRYA